MIKWACIGYCIHVPIQVEQDTSLVEGSDNFFLCGSLNFIFSCMSNSGALFAIEVKATSFDKQKPSFFFLEI
jgi:hypothetical protein